MEKSKENRIFEELNRISVLFEEIDENKKAIVAPLLQNAAFMRVTLEDLQEIINAEGMTDEYKNGANQYGVKQSASLQAYNTLMKNYAAVIRTLLQYLPMEKKTFTPFVWTQREKPEEERAEEMRLDEERAQKIQEEIRRAAEKQRQQREKNNH